MPGAVSGETLQIGRRPCRTNSSEKCARRSAALVSSVAAFWAYLTLLGRIGAARAGYLTVMFPVFALAISTVVEGYVWTGPAIVGLAVL